MPYACTIEMRKKDEANISGYVYGIILPFGKFRSHSAEHSLLRRRLLV